MQQDQRELCIYCGKWFLLRDMVTLKEKGKKEIYFYCESCYPQVKANLDSLPWKDRYTFYRR